MSSRGSRCNSLCPAAHSRAMIWWHEDNERASYRHDWRRTTDNQCTNASVHSGCRLGMCSLRCREHMPSLQPAACRTSTQSSLPAGPASQRRLLPWLPSVTNAPRHAETGQHSPNSPRDMPRPLDLGLFSRSPCRCRLAYFFSHEQWPNYTRSFVRRTVELLRQLYASQYRESSIKQTNICFS